MIDVPLLTAFQLYLETNNNLYLFKYSKKRFEIK